MTHAIFPVLVDVVTAREPMAVVDAARERGDEVRMVTGHDPAGDTVVVAWHVVPTNQYVIEGFHHGRWDHRQEESIHDSTPTDEAP